MFERTDRDHLETHVSERSLSEVVRLVRSICRQVAALHLDGRLHGAICATQVDKPDEIVLPAAVEILSLRGEPEGEFPPEAQWLSTDQLPADIAAARKSIAASGVDFDPRRIDIVQIAALTVRLCAGISIDDYLNSIRAKATVPAQLVPVIDSLLGFDPNDRFTSCEQVLAALDTVDTNNVQEPDADSSPDTPPHGSVVGIERDTPAYGNRKAAVSGSDPSSSSSGQQSLDKLGNYQIVDRIGAGGMGDVYRAYEPQLDRFVAIKVLPSTLSRQEDFVRRFQSEATAAAKLNHPNIVSVFSIGEDQGIHFFAMEFIDGESLADLLKRQGKLTVDQTLDIIEQALSGLAAAHRQGMIHRDIKPGNILLDRENNRAMLADFGLVKSVQAASSVTATGVIMGTMDYLSPEQARGVKIDGRSDLYSFGVLMYQLLSGQLPFQADSPTGMIFQHAYEQPRPLTELQKDVPQKLVEVINRLLAKSPDDRHASAQELLDDLRAVRADAERTASVSDSAHVRSAPYISAISTFTHDQPLRWYERLRQRVHRTFHRVAPQLADQLATTQQQFDVALAEYEERRDELARLVAETESAHRDLSEQAESHRAAAAQAQGDAERDRYQTAADDLQRQADAQAEALESLQVRLAELNAKLGSLKSQRDALNARLASAKSVTGADDRAARYRRRRKTIAVAGGVAVCLAGLAGVFLLMWKQPPPSIPTIPGPNVRTGDIPNGPSSTGHTDPLGLICPLEKMLKDALLHYSFEPQTFIETTDGIHVRDSSGNGLMGRVHGARSTSDGQVGSGLYFDGSDDYVVIPELRNALVNCRDGFAISCWIRQVADRKYGVVFDVGFYANSCIALLHNESQSYQFALPRDFGAGQINTPPNSPDWHHVVCVWDGSAQAIYVDGKRQISAKAPDFRLSPDSVEPHTARLGMHAKDDDRNKARQFVGILDEFTIFRRAVTEQEIGVLYDAGVAGVGQTPRQPVRTRDLP